MRITTRNFSIGRTAAAALFLFSLTFCQAGAQDILTFKNGKELKVIITEESTDVVKYREFSDQTGPEYSVKKEQIESIKYRKGQRDTGIVENVEIEKNQPQISNTPGTRTTTSPGLLTVKKRYVYLDGAIQSTRNVKTIMQDNSEALVLYTKGQKQCSMSNQCAWGVILTSLFVTLQNGKTEDQDVIVKNSAIGLVIDGVFITTAIVLVSSGKKKIRSAAEIYNEGIRNNNVSYKLDFGIQQHGVGLALKF
jgi:hypothetical protein